MNFLLLKYLHILSVACSFALLFIRGLWLLQSYPPAQEKWVKILPHAIDATLILSAIGMVINYPSVASSGTWMTAKLVALAVYIGLVIFLTRFARSIPQKILSWLAAMLIFLFITSVSVLHHPHGIFFLL